MDTEEFQQVAMDRMRQAPVLYGWQSWIARYLGVNDRTVRSWLETGRVPDWVAERLQR